MVWTVPDVEPKKSDGQAPLWRESMLKALRKAKMKVVEPVESEFLSQVAQAHRKGEKTYHVKAFRGSKDGMYAISAYIELWSRN